MVTGNLCALLRLEAGATDRCQASDAAAGIERALTASRRAELDGCIPGPNQGDLSPAMLDAARLGEAVGAGLGERHGWAWPGRLATRVITLRDYSPNHSGFSVTPTPGSSNGRMNPSSGRGTPSK